MDVKLQEEFNNGWNRMKETWGLLAKHERDSFNQMLEEVRGGGGGGVAEASVGRGFVS